MSTATLELYIEKIKIVIAVKDLLGAPVVAIINPANQGYPMGVDSLNKSATKRVMRSSSNMGGSR